MGTIAADVPGEIAGSKSKPAVTDSLENEAIGLEVEVRIHGSQVAAVVLDTTEHVEPFEEDTSTMIVFPRGAVVKLRARVRSGHAVVLTHLATKQTALCRIVQVNSAPNIVNYVKLEFVQPAPGFWGVHFPSDGAVPGVVSDGHPPINGQPEKFEAKVAPVEHVAPTSLPSAAQPTPRADPPLPEPKPILRECTKEIVRSASAAPISYGASEDITATEIIPLAAAPTKKARITHKPQTAIVPQPSRTSSHTQGAPLFDSLSTGEEVFGKASFTATAETAIVKSDSKAMQMFARSLNPSSLMQSVEVPKAHTGIKIFLSIAAGAILAAGAVFYVRQYRGNARQSASVATPASIPQTSAPTTSSAVPTQPTSTSAETAVRPVAEASTTTETLSGQKRPPVPSTAPQDEIIVTPVHNSAKNPDSDIHPTISNGLANIYAGDLSARPKPAKRKRATVQTLVPAINSTPKDLSGSSANTALDSLVSGSSSALPSLPKPAEPQPVVRGGVVSAPRLLHSVKPIYPALAMSNHIDGDVQIQALIDQTGKVVSTKVLSGPILLRRAATDAVQQWRYSPATLDGKPISMSYKVTVGFHLNE